MNKIILILIAFFLLLNVNTVLAQLDLPPGVEVVKEYNQQYAIEFIQSISIPLVFLAGILSFISPCILPLIPAFFSYTFREKRKITRMTLVFFFGFSIIFVIMGIAAAQLGQSLVMFQGSMTYLIMIAGLFLILFGIMAFLGRGFSSFIKINRKTGNDTPGVFLMGIFFAIGWSACLGPIIGGILLIAAVLGSVTYAAILLFVYSLGILTPMFILSLLYDRFNLGNNKWIKGKEFRFKLIGRNILTHSTEMISGILLIGLGLIFILFGGTSIINSISPIGSSLLFNELQSMMMNSPLIASVAGLIILVLLVVAISIKIFKRGRNVYKETKNEKQYSLLIVLLAGVILVSGCTWQGEQTTLDETTGEVKEFSITAKNWEFTPSTITVNKGDTVKLTITSTDNGVGSGHGIAIPAFGVSETLSENQPVTVEFVANQAGTFPFYCSVYCGSGHSEMGGQLVVNE